MTPSTVAVISVLVLAAISFYLIAAMFWHIRKEKRREGIKKTWKNFSLSLGFCILFLGSWAAHGLAEWQTYKADQKAHGEQVELVSFVNEFSQSTLENWQSEFLQLFSFVVMAALFVHHGSAESKDSEERIEAIVKRIEKRLEEKAS
jgi:NADH:ubiquinone oxidoreductase subunit 5 (subunit L)/multisubunit Na+/H+ antiporter MnhA subunit